MAIFRGVADSTVKIVGEFYNYEEQLIEPQNIKLIIYNEKWEKQEEFIMGLSNKIKDGSYFLEYLLPSRPQKLYYEWNAIIDGSTSISRDTIIVSKMGG